MKTYRYDQAKFNVSVTATGVFCVALLVTSALCLAGVIDVVPAPIAALLLMVCAYQVWNTFVAIANPQDVVIDDDTISFRAFGRSDTYRLADIESFSVREVGGDAYWLQLLYMNDGKELFQWIEDFEYRLDPTSLKARARRSSEQARAAKSAR